MQACALSFKPPICRVTISPQQTRTIPQPPSGRSICEDCRPSFNPAQTPLSLQARLPATCEIRAHEGQADIRMQTAQEAPVELLVLSHQVCDAVPDGLPASPVLELGAPIPARPSAHARPAPSELISACPCWRLSCVKKGQGPGTQCLDLTPVGWGPDTGPGDAGLEWACGLSVSIPGWCMLLGGASWHGMRCLIGSCLSGPDTSC